MSNVGFVSPNGPHDNRRKSSVSIRYDGDEIKLAVAGRWPEILAAVDPMLKDACQRIGKHGPCPQHGGVDGFRLFPDGSGGGICNTCGSFPDGFAIIKWSLGVDFQEARRRVAEFLGVLPKESPGKPVAAAYADVPLIPFKTKKTIEAAQATKSDPTPGDAANAQTSGEGVMIDLHPKTDKAIYRKLLRQYKEATHDAAKIGTYLRPRGITLDPPTTLKLHPAMYHDYPASEQTFPAIIAPVRMPNGQAVAIHKTFLAPDCSAKASSVKPGITDKKTSKAVFPGATVGGAIRLYPADAPLLAVGEGIETSLAVRQATHDPIWATKDAGGMERMALPDGINTLYVWADNDSPNPKTGKRPGPEAAEKLAARAHATGITVFVVTPPKPDTDWLDVLVAEGEEVIRAAKAAAVRWEPPSPVQAVDGPKYLTLAVGSLVKAGDRDNFGTIVADHGDEATVHFVSPSGDEATKRLPKSQLSTPDGRPLTAAAQAARKPFNLGVISSAEFAAKEYPMKYLIKGVLVESQPTMMAGLQKVMKTSTLVDAGISLATQTPFLNRFEVPERKNTLIVSGESGPGVLQETAKRICHSRNRLLSDASLWWAFRVPQIADDEQLGKLREAIIEHKIDVVLFDPIYLALMGGDTKGRSASNLFDMGPLLMRISDLGEETKSTIVLAHHMRKNSPNEKYAPPEMEDMAFAGFAEWARQWWLMGRRAPYEDGSGDHYLWFRAGGSAGHGGCWALDINEGSGDAVSGGRYWKVDIKDESAAQDSKRTAKEKNEDVKLEEQEKGELERMANAFNMYPEGETKNILKDAAGLSGTKFNKHLSDLLQYGWIKACLVKKNNKPYAGYCVIPSKWGAACDG